MVSYNYFSIDKQHIHEERIKVMDLGIEGKIALLPGGSQGIGAAAAQVLSEEGAEVAVCARSPEGLKVLQETIKTKSGREILTVQADFSKTEDINRAVQETLDRFGGIDILVNSVGSSMFGRFEQVPDDRWMSDISLKLFGTVRTCRAVVPHMRERGGGRIVNIAGNSGMQPYMWHLPGGAANAALLNFTHALAQDVCRDHILVTAVCPGPVETRRLKKQIKTMSELWKIPLERAEKQFYEELPLQRAATAEEVAYLVAFLVSAKASYISGTAITIDGCITKGL
jgi:NAD(P)-dependent dehydrogenase (short-subunit alcohol dehydrogenase family)